MSEKATAKKDLVCGIDTGGTFTDCVVLQGDGSVIPAKATSTPDNFADGVFSSLSRSAEKMGLTTANVLSRTSRFVVGTTVGTNSFLERKGAKVGLITTRGFEDTLYIMRGIGRTTGVAPRDIMMLETSFKPSPLIPKQLIRGVPERVDDEGERLLPVDIAAVQAAADDLVKNGVTAIAICFLWSFRNFENERQARDVITRQHPGLYICCSHEVAPKVGEYERFTATVINAYIGPVTTGYVNSIAKRCQKEGFEAPPLIMECNGGVMSSEMIGDRALVTLNSGPAGGVTASATLAKAMGVRNVITSDVGGTSFDVGIIRDGSILQTDKVEIGQYEFYSAAIDVRTIGAGGGSLARLDRGRRVISVGPESAGANPGPICYGRGGTQPTLTDAALHVGYVSAVSSLDTGHSSTKLDRSLSTAALGALGEELGLNANSTAAGIIRIAESHMADLVQRAVVSAGVDPRDFVLFAFGGAGPIHAAGFARDLGVKSIVVPRGDIASVWSAYGVATGDIMHVYEYAHVFGEPFDVKSMSGIFADLTARAGQAFKRERVEAKDVEYRYEIGIRYKLQLNEVYVELAQATHLSARTLADAVHRFEKRYAAAFGAEAGFREAGVEIVDFKVTARVPADSKAAPQVVGAKSLDKAKLGVRPVHFVGSSAKGFVQTPVYDGDAFPTNKPISGGALIQLSGTTVVAPPDYRVWRDGYGNFILERAAIAKVGKPKAAATASGR